MANENSPKVEYGYQIIPVPPNMFVYPIFNLDIVNDEPSRVLAIATMTPRLSIAAQPIGWPDSNESGEPPSDFFFTQNQFLYRALSNEMGAMPTYVLVAEDAATYTWWRLGETAFFDREWAVDTAKHNRQKADEQKAKRKAKEPRKQ